MNSQNGKEEDENGRDSRFGRMKEKPGRKVVGFQKRKKRSNGRSEARSHR